jgi:hypothetical protein
MSETPTASLPKPTLKERMTALVDVHGPVVLVVWLTLSVLTFFSFYFASGAGVDVSPVADFAVERGCMTAETLERTGQGAVACVGLQATKPIRFALTALLVPIVGRLRTPPGPTDTPPTNPA